MWPKFLDIYLTLKKNTTQEIDPTGYRIWDRCTGRQEKTLPLNNSDGQYLLNLKINFNYLSKNMCVPMPTHCTITRFGFRVVYFRITHRSGGPHCVWSEYLYSVL